MHTREVRQCSTPHQCYYFWARSPISELSHGGCSKKRALNPDEWETIRNCHEGSTSSFGACHRDQPITTATRSESNCALRLAEVNHAERPVSRLFTFKFEVVLLGVPGFVGASTAGTSAFDAEDVVQFSSTRFFVLDNRNHGNIKKKLCYKTTYHLVVSLGATLWKPSGARLPSWVSRDPRTIQPEALRGLAGKLRTFQFTWQEGAVYLSLRVTDKGGETVWNHLRRVIAFSSFASRALLLCAQVFSDHEDLNTEVRLIRTSCHILTTSCCWSGPGWVATEGHRDSPILIFWYLPFTNF